MTNLMLDKQSHIGKQLAKIFEDILMEFCICDKVQPSFKRFNHNLPTFGMYILQILSITCDNASNNDAMVDELGETLTAFGGEAAHMQCFLHVVNLVTKSLIQQFDMHKMEADVALNENNQKIEPYKHEDGCNKLNDSNEDGLCDENDKGWIDEVDRLSEDEQDKLTVAILPVKLALVKVHIEFK